MVTLGYLQLYYYRPATDYDNDVNTADNETTNLRKVENARATACGKI